MDKNTEKMWQMIAAVAGALLALVGLSHAILAGKRAARRPVEDTVLYTI